MQNLPCRRVSDLKDRTFEMIKTEVKKNNEKEWRNPAGLMGHNGKKQFYIKEMPREERNDTSIIVA